VEFRTSVISHFGGSTRFEASLLECTSLGTSCVSRRRVCHDAKGLEKKNREDGMEAEVFGKDGRMRINGRS
jgi:hypothetical protein